MGSLSSYLDPPFASCPLTLLSSGPLASLLTPFCSQVIDAGEIDDINILQAAMKAMECAAAGLGDYAADFVLVDGNRLPKVR